MCRFDGFFLEDVVGVEDVGVDVVVDVALFLEEDGVVPNDVDDFLFRLVPLALDAAVVVVDLVDPLAFLDGDLIFVRVAVTDMSSSSDLVG